MAKRRNAITGQWMARTIELLESPAYRSLTLSAHRALSRIEIELAHHAGQDNGKLQVRFEDFESYGVRRHSIGPALDELEALGLIKITERGKAARAAEYRRANKFLLTTRPELDGVGPEGCGWRRLKTAEEAEAAVAKVRKRRQEARNVRDVSENLKAASAETAPGASAETAPKAPNCQCRNGTTADGRNGTTIYISGREARDKAAATLAHPSQTAPPDLAPPLVDDAPALDDVPSKSPTPAAIGELVWTKPIVRELFGEERMRALADLEVRIAA